ncbi:MAG: carboxypeptidase-like regulatory domain-containing protein, partial [Bacteroides graminisolvens]
MKHLIILITILLSGTTIGAIHAQSVIKGYVIDEKTGEPITGATLVEKNTTNGTLTGINGEFSFKLQGQLPATLQVSFVGYRSKEAIVS